MYASSSLLDVFDQPTLALALNRLRIQYGNPSLDTLAERTGLLRSTLHGYVREDGSLPPLSRLRLLVTAIDPNCDLAPWEAAWRRITAARRAGVSKYSEQSPPPQPRSANTSPGAIQRPSETTSTAVPQQQSFEKSPHSWQPPSRRREHVDWVDDAPAETDLLQRKALAQVLTTRLARVSDDPHQASFLIHVDGPWGSGKSTLLKFLDEELSPTHLVVDFNAWRNARVQPPWWSLLTTIRDRVIKDRSRFVHPVIYLRETWARARRSGAQFFLAMLITVVLIGAAYLLLPPLTTTNLKTIGSVIAALGVLWAVGSIAAKFLLWNSARGAQLLERSHTDPMGEVSAQFGWLIKHSPRPVVIFIDDLDRCDGPTVVEILEAIQTLARDQPRPCNAASFVVAADGAWLRRAYEDHYAAFEGAVDQPGQPLGYLFQEKLFQLSVPVPSVGGEARASYLNTLLGGPGTSAPVLAAEQAATSRRIEDSASEAEVLDALKDSSQQVRQNLAPQAAMKLAEPEVEAATEHSLEKFAPRLQANPRGVKRFLNTYSILRTLRTLEGNVVGTDTLAAWALLRSRWPQLADHLEHNPQDIGLVREGKSRLLPKALRQTVPAPELRVFLGADDVALTEADIRACCGSAQSSPSVSGPAQG